MSECRRTVWLVAFVIAVGAPHIVVADAPSVPVKQEPTEWLPIQEITKWEILEFIRTFSENGAGPVSDAEVRESFDRWRKLLTLSRRVSAETARDIVYNRSLNSDLVFTSYRGDIARGQIRTAHYTIFMDLRSNGEICDLVLDVHIPKAKQFADLWDLEAFLRHVKHGDDHRAYEKAQQIFIKGCKFDSAFHQLFMPYKSSEADGTLSFVFADGTSDNKWGGVIHLSVEVDSTSGEVITSRSSLLFF